MMPNTFDDHITTNGSGAETRDPRRAWLRRTGGVKMSYNQDAAMNNETTMHALECARLPQMSEQNLEVCKVDHVAHGTTADGARVCAPEVTSGAAPTSPRARARADAGKATSTLMHEGANDDLRAAQSACERARTQMEEAHAQTLKCVADVRAHTERACAYSEQQVGDTYTVVLMDPATDKREPLHVALRRAAHVAEPATSPTPIHCGRDTLAVCGALETVWHLFVVASMRATNSAVYHEMKAVHASKCREHLATCKKTVDILREATELHTETVTQFRKARVVAQAPPTKVVQDDAPQSPLRRAAAMKLPPAPKITPPSQLLPVNRAIGASGLVAMQSAALKPKAATTTCALPMNRGVPAAAAAAATVSPPLSAAARANVFTSVKSAIDAIRIVSFVHEDGLAYVVVDGDRMLTLDSCATMSRSDIKKLLLKDKVAAYGVFMSEQAAHDAMEEWRRTRAYETRSWRIPSLSKPVYHVLANIVNGHGTTKNFGVRIMCETPAATTSQYAYVQRVPHLPTMRMPANRTALRVATKSTSSSMPFLQYAKTVWQYGGGGGDAHMHSTEHFDVRASETTLDKFTGYTAVDVPLVSSQLADDVGVPVVDDDDTTIVASPSAPLVPTSTPPARIIRELRDMCEEHKRALTFLAAEYNRAVSIAQDARKLNGEAAPLRHEVSELRKEVRELRAAIRQVPRVTAIPDSPPMTKNKKRKAHSSSLSDTTTETCSATAAPKPKKKKKKATTTTTSTQQEHEVSKTMSGEFNRRQSSMLIVLGWTNDKQRGTALLEQLTTSIREWETSHNVHYMMSALVLHDDDDDDEQEQEQEEANTYVLNFDRICSEEFAHLEGIVASLEYQRVQNPSIVRGMPSAHV